MNELMVLLAVYPLFIFTDYQMQLEPEAVINTGWVLVAIIAVNVAFNIVVFVVFAISTFYTKIKICCIKRRIKRELALRLKEQLRKKEELRAELKRREEE